MILCLHKRKNYKTFIYTAIIITLCLLIIAIAWPAPPEDSPSQNLDERVSAGIADNGDEDGDGDGSTDDNNSSDTADSEWEDDDDDDEDNEEDNFPTVEKPNMRTEGQSYYLVKKAGDVIKVFFVDQSGNEVELETTNIIYDVLGFEDQRHFEEGYKVGSQEELAMLLQDFES